MNKLSEMKQTFSPKHAKLIHANIKAIHAYQVLLALQDPKEGMTCYNAQGVSKPDLERLAAHQERLLSGNLDELKKWIDNQPSSFDPSVDLEPILNCPLQLCERLPVFAFAEWAAKESGQPRERVLSIANLYQTVLEVNRDGTVLQELFAFYIELGLPVYIGQLSLTGTDEALLDAGYQLAPRTCISPFSTAAKAWQEAGRKIWNWGEKHLHIRDDQVLADHLLQDPELQDILPLIKKMTPRRIAVLGHSFTMHQHWSSPSSFTQIVNALMQRVNPLIEIRHFTQGGLKAERAYERFYQDALTYQPDQALFVFAIREGHLQDTEALKDLMRGMNKIQADVHFFDNLFAPFGHDINRYAVQLVKQEGIEVLEVDQKLYEHKDVSTFICMDGLHMTEPFHLFMAKEWLKYLVGAKR